MNNQMRGTLQSIGTLMNALAVGGVAVACAVFVSVSGIPGLTA